MPVDLYVGGAEHAVLHLLYARFWHKVLFDAGHRHDARAVPAAVNQGMILGEIGVSRRERRARVRAVRDGRRREASANASVPS